MSRELSSTAWLFLGTTSEPTALDDEISALFRRCAPHVVSSLRRRYTEAVAQEATQEAFLRLHRARQGGTQIHNPEAWLTRVAQHVAVDQFRRRAVEVRLTSEALAAVEANGPRDIPERQCWERQRLDLVKQEIAKLSDRERTCLRMRAEGHTFLAIGAVVGMDYRRVADLMDRVLKRLRRVSADARPPLR